MRWMILVLISYMQEIDIHLSCHQYQPISTLVSSLRPSQLHVLVCTGSLVESSFEKEKDIILGIKSTEDENDLASQDNAV